jgi:hypothetical protein
MKHLLQAAALWLLLLTLVSQLATAHAQGTAFTYQGRVTDNGTNFTGAGQFKFALVTSTNTSSQATGTANAPSGGFITGYTVTAGGSGYVTAPAVTISGGGGSGATATANLAGGVVTSITPGSAGTGYTSAPTVALSAPPANITYTTYWSNDGTSSAGSEPTAAASVAVTNGLFTVVLGDTTLANMTTLSAALFVRPNLQLRIWFNDGVNGSAGLSPLQNLTPTPYAIQALNASSASNLLGTLPAAQIGGTVLNASLPGSPSFSGIVAATSFAGNGANVTGVNAVALNGLNATNFWQTGGNSGTTPGTQFVGTTDNQALEFKVNGSRALRLEPNATSPNVIGGYSGNYIAAGLAGATISGGGSNGNTNSIFADYSAIGGGVLNTIQPNAYYSTIGGGVLNTIQTGAYDSTIGGGYGHTIQTGANDSTIGGGVQNTIQLNAPNSTIGGGGFNTIQPNASYSTIGGGSDNAIQLNAPNSTIGGGGLNTIQTSATFSTIGGGQQNTIQTGANDSTIGGGYGNTIQTNAYYSTIGGGYNNTIQPNTSDSTIGGGYGNTIQPNASLSTIGGGYINTIQTNAYESTIGGGYGNTIQPNAQYAVIPGGRLNLATNYAFAAGYNARATNTGAFVWSDSTGTLTASTNANSVTMRASGGFRFFTGTGPVGASLAAGGTSWATLSDRNAKKNFQPLDGLEVLEKLSAIPVQHWNYKWEPDDAVPHIGPMAQDFKSAFYPGRDDKSITTLEFDGVELAAIQGLNQKMDSENAKLREELKHRDAENAELKQRLNALEQIIHHQKSN